MLRTLAADIEERYGSCRDRRGQPFSIAVSLEPGSTLRGLRHMYHSFEPKECSQGLPPASPSRLEAWLSGLLVGNVNLVAQREGNAVGHAVLLAMEPGKSGEYLVFVHQDHQDRGIGSALTRAAREIAESLDFCKLWLTVELLNPRAIHVYEKVGFHMIGPREAECEMALDLRLREECPD